MEAKARNFQKDFIQLLDQNIEENPLSKFDLDAHLLATA
jgi:hypothetical protein